MGAAEFRKQLGDRVWVADGAMGTMLHAEGIGRTRCCEELNVSWPQLVRDIHQRYVDAGAEIISTNTFGANRGRLKKFRHADQVKAINLAGVRLAREAAGNRAFIGGSIGPATVQNPGRIFYEQVAALVEAGVDCLILETFRDLVEVGAAVDVARKAAGDEMVLMVHLSVEEDGSLHDGSSVEEFTRALNAMPVDVIGLNCCFGPQVVLDTVKKMAAFTAKPLSAMPNAGLPSIVEGCIVYPHSADSMASYVAPFLDAGARIIGGCCGTTPEYVRLVAERLAR